MSKYILVVCAIFLRVANASTTLDLAGVQLEILEGLNYRLMNPMVTEPQPLATVLGADGRPLKLKVGQTKMVGPGIWEIAAVGPEGLTMRVKLRTLSDLPGAVVAQLSVQNGPRLSGYSLWHWSRGKVKSAWAYLPSSRTERPNWLRPLVPGFKTKEFMGMNATDYGGGTPVLAVWTKDFGLAIGSLSSKPQPISFPLEFKGGRVTASMLDTRQMGGQWQSDEAFLLPFRGDAFQALRKYSSYMQNHGFKMATSSLESIGPLWCAWGYGRQFTVDQIIATLPKVKEMGFEWVGVDDGWQKSIGDWSPNPEKFPAGESDVKRLVQAIHEQGLKAQLWWAPLAVHRDSDYVKKHGDRLLLNENQKPRDITWWDAWYTCPAQDSVRQEVAAMTRKFLGEWGFDGLKIDGQHLNASPDCFNSAHNHAAAADAFIGHAEVFKQIMTVAKSVKDAALVETCPCGANYSIYNLPFQNMTVASDPESSDQVRQKGKVLKALTGDEVVFFGDHADLVKGDFASTIGVGGLVGTNFTLPKVFKGKITEGEPDTRLTPSREKHWRKWLSIARKKPLWRGEYLGELYDIGFDRPETHAVRLGEVMHFALYAKNFSGQVELRGLKEGQKYVVTDYEIGRPLGNVVGPTGRLKVKFKNHLLVEVAP